MRIHVSRIPRSRIAFPDQLQGLGAVLPSALMATFKAVSVPKPAPVSDIQKQGYGYGYVPNQEKYAAWTRPAPNSVVYDYSKPTGGQLDSGPPGVGGIGAYRVGGSYYNEIRRLKSLPPSSLNPKERALLNRQLEADSGSSGRFKVMRAVTLGIIGIATGGAALTAAGIIGPGAAAATGGAATAGAVAPAATVTSAGMTAAAAAPAYAAQIAAAGSIVPAAATIGGGGLLSQAASYAIGAAKSAAISQITGLVQSKSAEFLANQFAPDVQDDPFAGTTFDQASVSGPPKSASSGQAMPWILAAAAIGFFVLLDTEKGKRHVR